MAWPSPNAYDQTRDINSLTWTGSQFVAVGQQGLVLTSADGISWMSRDLGTNENLNSITWTGSQLVTVGASNFISTSLDGIVWTQRITGLSKTLRSIIWTGSELAAVGDSGVIITSSNGIRWNYRGSITKLALFTIVWTGTQFVTADQDGVIYTSADGISWINRAWAGGLIYSIAWTGLQFVAVGDGGAILTSPQGLESSVFNYSGKPNFLSIRLTSSQLSLKLPVAMTSHSNQGIIYGLSGKKFKELILASHQSEFIVPISDLPVGTYQLIVNGDRGCLSKPFSLIR